MTTDPTTESPAKADAATVDPKAGTVQALRHPDTGETEALSLAVLAALAASSIHPTEQLDNGGAHDPCLHHEFGDALELLDEGGWYLTRYSTEPDAHPASLETRQSALAMAENRTDLAAVDRMARYLHDGTLPDTPVETELLAALAQYEHALAQPDDDGYTGALAAGRQLADTVAAALHA